MAKRTPYVVLLDKAKAAQGIGAGNADLGRQIDQELIDHLFHERGLVPTGWVFPQRIQ